jgi:signal transduction histidine kinase
MQSKYERQSYQFLSAFRFLAYALAAMFTQISRPIGVTTTLTDTETYVALGALGIYTLLRVFSPFRWQAKGIATYVILYGDFLICMLLVVFTGGLNSSFLLYSLAPIMTAALLYEERVSFSLAFGASISLSVAHLVLSHFNERITWIMQGQNITLLIIYTLFCFVTAHVPYRINLNIRRRIERDAILEERRRIGREIHDGVAQSISALNLKTKLVRDLVSANKFDRVLSEVEEMTTIAQNTYEDIRESIDELSSESRNLPLVTALAQHTRAFGAKNGIAVDFQVSKAFPQLSPVAELQLFRIAQEALTNVRRHALASRVEVRLNNDRQVIQLVVRDNGQGFNSPTDSASPGYHGLQIIRERAEGLGGTATIVSALGQGAEVKITLPAEKVRM